MSDPALLATVMLMLAAPAFGSFAGLLAVRLPAGEPVIWGRSRCDACGCTLRAADLLPIAGWVLASGRCRTCGHEIPRWYPALEVMALVVALWAIAVESDAVSAWITAALGWTLLTLAVIDMRSLLLPDALTLPLAAGGLVFSALFEPAALHHALIGAALGYGSLALIAALYRRRTGREGLGLGDAKLFAAAGAWTGWAGLPGVLLVASLSGLAWAVATGGASARKRIAFGPFLAAGLWIIWLYGPLRL